MPLVHRKPDETPEWNLLRDTVYKSQYITMLDGVKLALDLMHPRASGKDVGTTGFPTVFIQCRYMRGVAPRWPFSIWSGHRPVDFINQDLKVALLKAGYAVVSIDVRGTGASFGKWRMLWSPEEVEDSLVVLDWICQQRWSSGQVVLCGMSYEATAALQTLSHGHPSVKAAILRFPFWSPFEDISCPGGIPQEKFAKNWTAVTKALDKNDMGGLSWMLKPFFRGCQPVIEEPWPSGSILSCSYWKSWLRHWQAESRAGSQLRAALGQHASFDAARALSKGRFPEQIDEQSQLSIKEVSACNRAAQIRQANVPMLLMAGWLDATAAPALTAFVQAAPRGSRLVIGPWTHGGLSNNPVGHQQQSSKSRFNQVKYAVQFMDHTLGHDGMDGHLAAGKKRNEGCNEGGPQREQSSKDEAGTDDDVTRVRIDTSLRQMADVISQSSTSMRRAALETASDTLVPSTVATSPFTADQGELGTAADGSMDFDPRADAVHWFRMGHRAGWCSSPSWPPKAHRRSTSAFFLSGEDSSREGALSATAPRSPCSWQHIVEAWKHPKGQSRYECMTDLRTPMAYSSLASCGHLLFTSSPLQAPLEFTGWPVLNTWVSSSDTDADLFCYLESFDPASGDVAYVTEGSFRASHRKLAEDVEDRPQLGMPCHSFEARDTQPLQPGMPALCQFTMLPTSFTFAEGHCVRLAISGSDTKHFSCDRACYGSRSIGIHSSLEQTSMLRLP